MYSNILIATDLSRDSGALVRCVAGLVDKGCRRAHLVYGLEVEDIGPVRASLDQLLQPELDRQMAVLRSAGIEPISHIALYPISREIERIAGENDCSLVVAGSRVHSLAGEMTAGSMAGTVLTSTRRPLLMLRLSRTDPDDSPSCACWPCAPLKHLLVPTDFSENAEHAFGYIERFVKEQAPGRITLLHVQDRRRIDRHLKDRLDEFNATDRERLERLRDRLAAVASAEIVAELPYGHPAAEIVEYCCREAVSLVVMGTQGRGHVKELFLGSVSHSVARQAPVPVLLIPQPL